ncbi:transporter [Deltaproteobacteria bacterium Smac51]|nr:transporter [Deltaproteobacteria bacterium Smac51]
MSGIKTSARNVIFGKVKKITLGAVNAEVILDAGGHDIVAIITNESVKSLGLTEGREAYALVKASWVIITESNGNLKVSARNHLEGTVEAVNTGAVNTEVVLDLPGGTRLVAVITNESAKNLELKPGVKAGALIKASHVIIAVEA